MFNFFGKSKKQKTIEQFLSLLEKEIAILHTEIQELDEVALSSLEQWYAFLEERDITPVEEKIKEYSKELGLPIPAVAFPSEYYKALIFVLQKATNSWRKILDDAKEQEIFIDIEEDIETFRYAINVYYNDKLSEYIKKSKPKLSVQGIFGNASSAINKHSKNQVESKSYSIKCKACGAARLEEDQCDECFYCGSNLF